MILAIDVYYYENNTAKAVGVLFNWNDREFSKVVTKYVDHVEPYVPGQFYKRELPCVLEIIKEVSLQDLDAIIVDGHVYVDTHNFGLGGYVWKALNQQIPVIGVAKSPYYANAATVAEVCRGESKYPLYVSAIGLELKQAQGYIQNMSGKYRIPDILKVLDRLTKE